MKLFSFWRSLATYRVRIALNLKGLSSEMIPIHLLKQGGLNKKPEYRAVTPHPYGLTGAVLVFGSVASWCIVVIAAGGVSGFFVSYEDFLQMTSGFSLPLAVISPALACGVVLTVSGGPGWHRTSAMVAFAAFAIVALPIGLRTEVMFPAVAAVVALENGQS